MVVVVVVVLSEWCCASFDNGGEGEKERVALEVTRPEEKVGVAGV